MKRERPETQLHVAHDDETEKLREWWKRNGTGIIAGVVIGIGGVGGIQGWRMYEDSQAGKASVLYQEMLGAAAAERSEAASAAKSSSDPRTKPSVDRSQCINRRISVPLTMST